MNAYSIKIWVYVKLDFEIAADQQTKAHDRTFEKVPDSGSQVPTGARGTAAPLVGKFLAQFCQITLRGKS